MGLDSELSSFTTTQLTHLHLTPVTAGQSWAGLGVFRDCEQARGTSGSAKEGSLVWCDVVFLVMSHLLLVITICKPNLEFGPSRVLSSLWLAVSSYSPALAASACFHRDAQWTFCFCSIHQCGDHLVPPVSRDVKSVKD